MVTNTYTKFKSQFGFWPTITAVIFLVMLILALNVAVISAFVWVICWIFGFEFFFHYVIGVWAFAALLRFLFRK